MPKVHVVTLVMEDGVKPQYTVLTPAQHQLFEGSKGDTMEGLNAVCVAESVEELPTFEGLPELLAHLAETGAEVESDIGAIFY